MVSRPPEILTFRPDRPVVPLSGQAEMIRFTWDVQGPGQVLILFAALEDGGQADVSGYRSLTIALMARRLGAHQFSLIAQNMSGTAHAHASVHVEPAGRHHRPQRSGKIIGPYRKLGLQPDATEEEVKAAYRKLVMQAHPDHGGDPDVFRDVQEAYQILMKGQQPSCYGKGLRGCVHGGCWRCRRESIPVARPSYRPSPFREEGDMRGAPSVTITEEILEMAKAGVLGMFEGFDFTHEMTPQEVNEMIRRLANEAIQDGDL